MMKRLATTWVVVLVAAVGLFADQPPGDLFIPLGPSDNLSLDQPRVAVEVYEPGPPKDSFGPEWFNTFLLDTGASGVVAVSYAVEEMQAEGYQTVAVYDEQGVAGTEPFGVSAEYNVDFLGSSTDPNDIETLAGVRILSNAGVNFGDLWGIAGMPAMVQRTTSLDLSLLGDWSLMGVEFGTAVPSGSGHRYTVPLNLVEFPASGQRDPNDPLPTFAPLPFAQVCLRHAARTAGGAFLVDTGAQMSMISSNVAFALGMDANGNGTLDDEAVYFELIGGIGGTILVPVLELDGLALPTAEGVKLEWTDLQVLVADIDERIPGILGMELLTSGWLDAMFGLAEAGYIEQVHFDFLDAANLAGTMLLDINPDLDDVWIPGDANHDGIVNVADLGILGANYRQTGKDWSSGDFNGDGLINVADLGILGAHYGYSIGGGAVPEPTSIVLLGLAAAGVLRPRRSRRL